MTAISQEYFNQHYRQTSPDIATSEFDIVDTDFHKLLDKYTHLNELIAKEALAQIHTVRPLIDGKQICELYGIKPGKAIKFIMDEELKFQILKGTEATY